MSKIAAEPSWLKTRWRSPGVGVDREAEVIRGYIVAQEGPFKTPGRGEFDREALATIVAMTNAAPNGLKSRLAHPSLSDDGVGKFLGRVRNARLDTIADRDSEGELRSNPIQVVRGDLHLDPSAHSAPAGDLAEYVMALAESDPDAFSSSLVLQIEREYRIDAKGRRLKDEDGEDLPPLWRPKRLHASDVVDTGDAVDGMLSASLDGDGLPDAIVRQASDLLDRQFPGATREAVEARCLAWLGRYLDLRFGEGTGRGLDPAVVRARLRNHP